MKPPALLVIACGALSHEIESIKKKQPLTFDVKCLPANLHNRPTQIPAKVEQLIVANRSRYRRIFVAYADCGTGGLLDKLLNQHQIKRLPGAHCYQMFSPETFEQLDDTDLGTFYLTDFLARHFDRLILQELGIIDNPEFREIIFKNYHTLLYLIQNPKKNYRIQAKKAANILGLDYQEQYTGYAGLQESLIHFSNKLNT